MHLAAFIAIIALLRVSGTLLDHQLYSRQMLVYGQSTQEKIMESHIAVVGSG
jgi:molybdopterin/thiamine biosynthesis adenylyltransferase